MMMKIRLVLGWIMILLGAYVALHPLWSHGKPVTTSLWLDMAFAAVFLLRGVMNIRGVRRRPTANSSVDS
jgi:hypothetical protein